MTDTWRIQNEKHLFDPYSCGRYMPGRIRFSFNATTQLDRSWDGGKYLVYKITKDQPSWPLNRGLFYSFQICPRLRYFILAYTLPLPLTSKPSHVEIRRLAVYSGGFSDPVLSNSFFCACCSKMIFSACRV